MKNLFLTIIISNLKKNMDLNYPFRIYPLRARNIFTSYIDNNYLYNVKKLYDDIGSLIDTIDNNELIILVIGSLIDEQPNCKFSNQSYYQHLPIFVKKYMEENESKRVRIICISPVLNDDQIPTFIKKSMNEFKWYNVDINKYVSSNYNLSYDFYNTLFPEYIEHDLVTNTTKKYYLKHNGNFYRLPRLYFRNRVLRDNFELVSRHSDKIILKLKDEHYDTFCNFYKSSPNENDKIFVRMFLDKLKLLVNILESKSGGMLVLNYAVFRDNWACTPFTYFFQTFYQENNNFQNIKFLNYEFIESKSSKLIEYNKRDYNYESYDIMLKLGRKGRINIISQFNKSKKFKKSNDFLDDKSSNFKFIKIDGDGDCLFNAILKQIDNVQLNLGPCDARKIVYNKIINDDEKLKMLKEELIVMPEYESLIKNECEIDKVLDLHLYFIREGPYSEAAENVRKNYNLPFSVFFGGNCEIGILGELFNLNIDVINYDNKLIKVMDHNIYNKTIYIKFYGNHYDIAIPKDNDDIFKYNQNKVNNITI